MKERKIEVPRLNLQDYTNGNKEEKEKFIQELGKGFEYPGFVIIKGTVPKQHTDDFYSSLKQFAGLEQSTKDVYKREDTFGQRGYVGVGTEAAKQSTVADLKEFLHIGEPTILNNQNIEEVPELMPRAMDLFHSFKKDGAILLRAIAEFLGLDINYFDERIHEGDCILRALHYPPITVEPKSAIRAEQHEDIDLITLLVGASAGGLQLLDSNNEWQDISPEEDEIVINVGDMLQRLTNNRLKSTTHRVINPPKEEWHIPRYSIPFFLHLRPEVDISCLPSCVTDKRPLAYEPITAGEYLDERLREIGLKK